jgi:class 3 adenylate cyclase
MKGLCLTGILTLLPGIKGSTVVDFGAGQIGFQFRAGLDIVLGPFCAQSIQTTSNTKPREQDYINSSKLNMSTALVELSECGSYSPSDDDSTRSGCSNRQDTAAKDKETERATLGSRETIVVSRMKSLVVVVLLATTILVSTGVFLYTKNEQLRAFEESFLADANLVLEAFHQSVERSIEAVDALSVSITSHAIETQSTFPNVSLPDVAFRFGNARILSGSPYVEYIAVVTDETRLGFEAFALSQQTHYQREYEKEYKLRASQDKHFGRSDPEPFMTWNYTDEIYNLSPNGTQVAPMKSGPYLPLLQFSPVMPTFSNLNTLSFPVLSGGFHEAAQTGQAVIDHATNLGSHALGDFDTSKLFSLILSKSQYRHQAQGYLGDPLSSFAYPVFDSFDLETRKVVGVLGTMLYWRIYLDVLPKDTRGVICVLENSNNQTFTYQIDKEVKYLGYGDRHDHEYDGFVQSGDIATYIEEASSPATKSLSSVDLNTAYSRYKIRIYPSDGTKKQHVDSNPVMLALLIVGVFLFSSSVFVLYTIAVARRQRIVMDRAVASSAIVSSLFPSQVRDQIYEENEAGGKTLHPTADSATIEKGVDGLVGKGRPIAEVFEHTTVMFADISGFTSWSASRNPVQVFELLEALYRAFDSLAVRRKVFKVETIGDCYVAVTGLPDPQADHAVLMARFADDCMKRMSQLTMDLASTLGEDTATLAMRVGLHSGPVTGGVLRGQKSRFQLFGDTMNTASRMESNGERGRIHVSQATADALIAKGKSSWVVARPDKITAKGKGEMQTYWVNPHSAANTHVTVASSGVFEL